MQLLYVHRAFHMYIYARWTNQYLTYKLFPITDAAKRIKSTKK